MDVEQYSNNTLSKVILVLISFNPT